MRPFKLVMAVASVLVAVGCAAPSQEDESADQGQLRADANSVVSTFAPTVHLLDGYNSLLDRATARCVEQSADARADVGDERTNYYLRLISTSEDLAKELEINVAAASNVPTTDASAALGLVKTFKQSSSKVSFLLRAVRSYQVSASTPKMTEHAAGLARGASAQKLALECGGSYVKAIRYEAQVLAILEFEASSVEEARKIQLTVTASAPTVPVKGTAGVKASIQTAAKTHAFNSQIVTSGFSAHGAPTTDDPAQALASFDALTRDMNESVDADVTRDRAGYFANNSRVVRPVSVSQGSYAAVPGAPDAERFGAVTTLLGNSEKYYRGLSSVLARIEYVYGSELKKFLDDTKNQYRYNRVGSPMATTSALVKVANAVAKEYRSDDPTTIAGKLEAAADRCLEGAGNGDYSACRESADSAALIRAAEDALHKYDGTYAYRAAGTRIVELAAHAPTGDGGEMTKVSYRNAEPTCRAAGMRLPSSREAALLLPMLRALGGATAEMWLGVESANDCAAPYYKVGDEVSWSPLCDKRATEGLPYVNDRVMICVPPGGPVPVLRKP